MSKQRQFFTPVKIAMPQLKLGADAIFTGIGSCFAQAMLQRLFDCKFNGLQNPSGIIYNMVSIARVLQRLAQEQQFGEEDFFEFNGKWRSWEHHGSYARASLSAAIEAANKSQAQFMTMLQHADCFIVTPSSSVVYVLRDGGQIVANCHKVRANRFKRRLLEVKDNLLALNELCAIVKAINPACRVILTVSPVRHYPGDLCLNSVSKANLMAAVRKAVELNQNSEYFPAYEIMHDELRDYRFYKDDMLHPSPLAETVIFERFTANYFSSEAQVKIVEAIKKNKAAAHRLRSFTSSAN